MEAGSGAWCLKEVKAFCRKASDVKSCLLPSCFQNRGSGILSAFSCHLYFVPSKTGLGEVFQRSRVVDSTSHIRMDMADTISVILEYLKSHQLVKTEAALQDELRALLTDEVDSELRMQVCNNENDETNEQPEQAHVMPNAIQQEAEMAKDNLFNTSPLETKDASTLNDPAVSNDGRGRLKIKLRCLETAGSERVELEMLPENQSGNAGIEPTYDTEEAFSVDEARQHASMKAEVGCSSPTKLEKHNISIKGGVIVLNAGLREEKPGLLWVLPERQAEEQSQSVRMLDSLQKAGHFQEHEGSVNAVLSEIRKDIEQADNTNAACGETTDDVSMSNLNMIRPLAVQHQENVQLTCGNSQRDQCSCRKETIDWNGRRTLACVEVSGNSDSCKDQTFRSGQEDREGYPRLAPVRLKTVDGSTNECSGNSRKSSGSERFGNMEVILENCCSLGSNLDIPVGQSGLKHLVASSRPSVTQDIIRGKSDIQELGHGDIVASYKDELWDSDAYEDDDDPGYVRRTIEDEAWFLANEIIYPSDGDRRKDVDSGNRNLDKEYGKYSDDERSCMESYYSGEDYFRQHRDDVQHGLARTQDNELVSLTHLTSDYNENLLVSEELDQIQANAAWQGFLEQGKLSEKLRKSETILDTAVPVICDHFLEFGTSGIGDSRSGVNSKERLLVSEGSEGGSISCQGSKDLGNCSSHSRIDLASNSDDVSGKIDLIGEFQEYAKPTYDDGTYVGYYVGDWLQESCAMEKKSMVVGTSKAYETTCGKGKNGLVCHFQEGKAVVDVGDFSFPSSSSTVEGKSCSAKETSSHCDDMDDFSNDFIGPDDTLATWRRKSNCSSPIISLGEDVDLHCPRSDISGHSSDVAISVEAQEDAQEEEAAMQMEEAEVSAAYDEEAMAVHQHIQRLQAEEEEFETFNLKIIHRRSRTGFEEEKDFPIVINSVVAGRYHVTEYLGSAAFSNAIQAHDLYTGLDVCMKIIKNNKDFFDQSLDEIKLLKYINKHDPADKHHILRLYDYFYHREHLFIVCELLRANLYEFQKYKRESGGEVYFTMPRLQSITRQCLEALDFLHGLGLIHCDLKPENILVKSYSRCEVKVIDFGSSCFQTDHLCSYVQSRSYRAPEVILGLPYDQKIDIWSLGCILAELWTGNVLFQNDSLATLLARIVGIIGPVEPEMLSKGRDSYRYFTRNYMLYERNAETEHLEYLLPKKTSLKHRLPGGDEGFIEFVTHLLQVNPTKRPMAKDALKHSWLSYPYEPISS